MLEQFFIDNRLTSLKELTMDVDFEFTYFKDHMKETRTNLHTFQVSWYLAIANRIKSQRVMAISYGLGYLLSIILVMIFHNHLEL